MQRWVKFSKYLPQFGWQPVIYTPENPETLAADNSLADEISPDTEVVRRRITEPYRLYRRLLGNKSSKDGGSDEVNPVNSGKKTFMQKLSVFARGNFFIPDPRCMWIRPSVRFLKKYLRDNPVDLIVSTGPPHSMHLIGLKLSRATGLPWIADFRDPWTKMFYFKHLNLSKWAARRHAELERQVLDGASAVVAVSPPVQKDFAAMTSSRVELVTNGFDETDFSDSPGEPDGFFNITHTGLFASDGNPLVLWKALADKCREDGEFGERLRIRLAGKTDTEIISSIEEAGLGGRMTDCGYLPHKEAVREQRNASLLILPLRREPEYAAVLPGKLFEYIASGRPVLGIGQTDGAMASVLAAAGAGTVAEWEDEKAVSAYVSECWEKFKAGTLRTEARDTGRFSRRALAEGMAAIMDSLTEKQSQK